jgi:hypothetical protein
MRRAAPLLLVLLGLACRTAGKPTEEAVDTGGAEDTGDVGEAVLPCPVFVAEGAEPEGDGTEAAPVPSIGDALAIRATDCLDIWVGPGTYTEDVDFGDAELRLVGTEGAFDTTLVGTGAGAVVTIRGGQAAAELTGFRITGGAGWLGEGELSTTETWGGGVAVYDSDVRLEDVIIDGNTATGGGGGLVLHRASAVAREVIVGDNTVDGGAGGEGGGILVVEGLLDAEGLFVAGNAVAASGDARGGGIAARSAEVRATDLVVEDNHLDEVWEASGAGGAGIAVRETTLAIDRTTVLGNTLSCVDGGAEPIHGAGITALASTVSLQATTLVGNTATGAACHLRGGALSLEEVDGSLVDLDLRDNLLELRGTGRAEGAGLAVFDSSPTLSGLVVAGNRITSDMTTDAVLHGGGLWLARTSPDLRRSTVHGNRIVPGDLGLPDVAGAGLYMHDAAPTLVGVLVTGNLAELPEGPDVQGGAGGVHATATGEPAISHSDVWSNVGDDADEAPAPAADGNLAVDPLYADASGTDALLWDLSLQAGSPCIDAGDPEDTDEDGSRADMGAP